MKGRHLTPHPWLLMSPPCSFKYFIHMQNLNCRVQGSIACPGYLQTSHQLSQIEVWLYWYIPRNGVRSIITCIVGSGWCWEVRINEGGEWKARWRGSAIVINKYDSIYLLVTSARSVGMIKMSVDKSISYVTAWSNAAEGEWGWYWLKRFRHGACIRAGWRGSWCVQECCQCNSYCNSYLTLVCMLTSRIASWAECLHNIL
jgi:hypothetical protein